VKLHPGFDALRHDIRFAMRALHRNPMHAALITATLAIDRSRHCASQSRLIPAGDARATD
jgi:hypothetical protein